jgi:DDE family transposase
VEKGRRFRHNCGVEYEVDARTGAAFLMAECTQETFEFAQHFSRRVLAQFDGAWMTSDGGGLLLRRTDRKIRLLQRAAACFRDGREPARVEHTVGAMLAQRIYGLALGYEDLNDHEQLRHDPLLALLAGKREVEEPLAGKSTWNRMELTPEVSHAQKITSPGYQQVAS